MRHFVIIILLLIPTLTFARLEMADYWVFSKVVYVDTTGNNVTIDNLKIGSKYLVNVESNGCFHHTKLNLTISRNANGYFATFRMTGKIEGQKIKHQYSKTKLTESHLDSIKHFEKRLIDVSKQKLYCTTVDLYNLNDGLTSKLYKDDTCNWEGIGKLVAVLFRRQK